MNKFYEENKIDVGLVSQAINNTNATGRYYSMKNLRRVIAILNGGAMAADKTSKIELLQATNADGDDSKAITDCNATVTSGTLISAGTIALASVSNGETVMINGLTFTAHTDTTTAADREFSIAGSDTADAAALAGLINDSTYGVPGVTAAADTGTITLTATDPGAVAITATSEDATFTISTTQSLAYTEVGHEALDNVNGVTHVAAKVTTTADTVVGVTMLRYAGRELPPSQAVGASASV